MKYRGFSSITALTRWGLVAVAIGIVLGGTAPIAIRQLGDLVTSQSGSVPWVSSRLLAFVAYGAIAASVIYGLLLSSKLLDAVAHRPITFTLHQDLAAVGLGLSGIHGALLGLDRTVPASIGALAIPFATSYRPLWVGFGQLAFWISAAVVASFYLRRRIGQRAWRRLHYATFLAFVGATAHGIGAGTDSSGPARWIYLGATVAVVFLLAYRIAIATLGRAGRTTAPAALVPERPATR